MEGYYSSFNIWERALYVRISIVRKGQQMTILVNIQEIIWYPDLCIKECTED